MTDIYKDILGNSGDRRVFAMPYVASEDIPEDTLVFVNSDGKVAKVMTDIGTALTESVKMEEKEGLLAGWTDFENFPPINVPGDIREVTPPRSFGEKLGHWAEISALFFFILLLLSC